MRDELDNMGDAELSAVFAREVAGWIQEKGFMRSPDFVTYVINKSESFTRFATDANAVLPWLNKQGWAAAFLPKCVTPFTVCTGGQWRSIDGCADSFARAACLALIRAKRAGKGAGE
jgi:hypothetical protein